MQRIESAVREFIEKDFFDGVAVEIDREQSLLESGIIDSMALFRLISFLQEKYEFTVPDGDLLAENFQSLATIAMYVKARQKEADSGRNV